MKRFLPILPFLLFFLVLKLSDLGIRLSDTNVYFYTAYQLLQGKMLYKDIFFTNLPLIPYVGMLYYFLVGGHLDWYFLTAAIEVLFTTTLIFHILLKQTKTMLPALSAALVYLFSFMILSTSDHQTGVFLASLFAVLSYYCFLEKRILATGIFTSLMLLTKAYFAPILLTYLLLFALKKRQHLLRFLAGFLLPLGGILIPTYLISGNSMLFDTFSYSLTRAQGVPKAGVFWFFLTHDILFAVLLLFNLFMLRKHLFFGLLSFLSLLFLLLYKDVYYLYLNLLAPFLALSFPLFATFVQKKLHLQRFVLPSLVAVLLIINLTIYLSSFRNLQKITNLDAITQTIKNVHPQAIYGTSDSAPALAYLTHTPLLGNIVDTNDNIFRKGLLNSSALTKQAIAQHALIVTHGASYQPLIEEPIIDGIFDKKLLQKSCPLLASFPVQMEGVGNRLNLFHCR